MRKFVVIVYVGNERQTAFFCDNAKRSCRILVGYCKANEVATDRFKRVNLRKRAFYIILLPSSAGNGNKFITARFAEIIATTYKKLSNPSDDT